MKNLIMLEYTDHDGQSQNLRLKDELSKKWEEMGDLLGLSLPQLNSISKRHTDPLECCREVLVLWFEMGGDKDYELSWKGMVKLLDNLRLNKISKDLEFALFNSSRQP